MATATSTTQRQGTSSSLASRICFWLLALLLLGVVFAYATVLFGSVQGEEFAPETFARRRFHYRELPVIGIQITPTARVDETGDLQKYIVNRKLVPVSPKAKDADWDLVHAFGGSAGRIHGDARILCRYFDAVDGDRDIVWLKWSKGHTEQAKVLWPAIAELARQELYSFMPDLFLLARSAASAEALQAAIDETLTEKYLIAAKTFQDLKRDEAAIELFSEALRHDPNCVDALAGRAKSFTRTGQSEKAATDSALARERQSAS